VAVLGVNAADLVILVVLALARGWPVVAFALAGFVLSVAYTAPPLRLKKRGLGEPDVLVVWGPLMVGGTYYAAVGSIPWPVLLASLPYALLCTSVLMGKHTDKIPYDEPLGIRTLPVLLGERRARAVTLALMAGCSPRWRSCTCGSPARCSSWASPWPPSRGSEPRCQRPPGVADQAGSRDDRVGTGDQARLGGRRWRARTRR
jgi:hypothetical protein